MWAPHCDSLNGERNPTCTSRSADTPVHAQESHGRDQGPDGPGVWTLRSCGASAATVPALPPQQSLLAVRQRLTTPVRRPRPAATTLKPIKHTLYSLHLQHVPHGCVVVHETRGLGPARTASATTSRQIEPRRCCVLSKLSSSWNCQDCSQSRTNEQVHDMLKA